MLPVNETFLCFYNILSRNAFNIEFQLLSLSISFSFLISSTSIDVLCFIHGILFIVFFPSIFFFFFLLVDVFHSSYIAFILFAQSHIFSSVSVLPSPCSSMQIVQMY